MRTATLVYPVTEEAVLLAPRKRGPPHLSGFLNGFGGKVEEGESVEAAAARELLDECGLTARAADFLLVGVIDFFIDAEHAFSVHAFLLKRWVGSPRETDEMGQPEWFPRHSLPFERMLPADRQLLPIALAEAATPFRAVVRYRRENNILTLARPVLFL